MASTYTRLLVHIVFSTKDRRPTLHPKCHERLYAYMGGIIHNVGGKPITINGMPDHTHILTHFPTRLSIADLLRTIKSNSSRWLTDSHLAPMFAGWQTGYSAFSVNPSGVSVVRRYIDGQKEHHCAKTFEEELLVHLAEAGVEYDERYLWA